MRGNNLHKNITMLINQLSSSVASHNKNKAIFAKADSAASDHYFRDEDRHVLKDIHSITSGPIILPNQTTIKATSSGILPISSELTPEGRTAKILPDLRTASLISVGKLCDDGCKVIFDKKMMTAKKEDKIILTGHRNHKDGLYDIPIQKTRLQEDHYVRPPRHAAIYRRTQFLNTKKGISTINKRTSSHHLTTFPPDLKTLRELVMHNALDQYIKHVLKQDKKFQRVEKIKQHTSISVIIRKDETKHDLVKYLHAACFAPVQSTWIRAIKNNHFSTWPGLNVELIKKHLPTSVATVQGHVKRERQGLQSTTNRTPPYKDNMQEIKLKFEALKNKRKNNEPLEDTLKRDMLEDAFPISPVPNIKCNEVAYAVIHPESMSNAYFDMTGRFPHRSTRGNKYIMVGYHYDSNSILAKPMKDRNAASMVTVWNELHQIYKKAAVAPHIYILDNEFSQELRSAMEGEKVKYQLVPPHSHRNNLAERAIQTFKSHFKSGLATCDPNFPITEWDRLIDQSNITLNLLRSSRANPKLSAWAYLFGEFNFNATPLAPPGTKIVAHKDAKVRGSWDLNGEQG
jgi:hypothetical protein